MIHNVFADSLLLHEKQNVNPFYCFIGVPFDGTSSFRTGSRKGPHALREASYNFESYNPELEVDLQDLALFDAGDVPESGTVESLRSNLHLELEGLFSKHDFLSLFPIFLGGEHSLTPMVLDFILPKVTHIGSKIGVIYLDAHMDMRDDYLGIRGSHASAARRIAEIVGMENIIPIGVRSWSKEEADFIDPYVSDGSFSYYRARDIRSRISETVEEIALEKLQSNGCDRIYLSIDMDVFDPSIAPGVGNPEPGGLSYPEVLDIIDLVSPLLCGMDLVETNPMYDQGITALLGAKVIRDTIAMHFTSTT
jgi:agmatinase